MTVQVNGQLIKELRINHSYSQEKLADIVGVNLRTIQRIETNGVAALSTRGALAKALGVKPEDLDVPSSLAVSSPVESTGQWPRRALSALSVFLVVVGATVLAIDIKSGTPIAVVTPPSAGGLLIALMGLVTLARLTAFPRWRTYALLGILVVSLLASPPAWTIRTLVAISLWAAFELGVLATKLRLRVRHS